MTRIAPLVLLSLVGCSSPNTYTNAEMTPYDDRTEYHIEDQADGFTIFVNYTQYSMVHSRIGISEAGKSAMMSLAYELADKRGKKLQPIEEQRVKMSTGRNGLSGNSFWGGTVRVFYQGAVAGDK